MKEPHDPEGSHYIDNTEQPENRKGGKKK